MEGFAGVRKGSWSEGEDVLLKQCIETYGEGSWHKIPLRAGILGLNRCRKSCRLRWLNYLKPDIKRSRFEDDEVDLMIRLHKLLGNRWSLIAGRLPGRTANDVKNYWNTHLRKKEEISRDFKIPKSLPSTQVMRPQPRNFSKSFILRCQEARLKEFNKRKEQPTISCPSPSPSQVLAEVTASLENEKEWWETVLAEVLEGGGEGNNGNEMISVGGSDLEHQLKTSGEVVDCIFEETQWNWWGDMQFDICLDHVTADAVSEVGG